MPFSFFIMYIIYKYQKAELSVMLMEYITEDSNPIQDTINNSGGLPATNRIDTPPPPPCKPGKKRGWQPGQSGNPNGRPKKGKSWKEILDKLLSASCIEMSITSTISGHTKTKKTILKVDDKYTLREAITTRQMEIALSDCKDRMAAISDLMDRDMGKPHQTSSVDHSFDLEKAQVMLNADHDNTVEPSIADLEENLDKPGLDLNSGDGPT